MYKPTILVGVYNPTNGTRGLKSVVLTDITPNVYKLYKCGTAQLYSNDYIYVFNNWNVQADVASWIEGKPNQLYDVYLSMKCTGPSYGGSSSDPDKVYIDRIILVGKGVLPTELQSIPSSSMTDFSPEAFRVYTASGGIGLGEDGTAKTLRSAKVSPENFRTETDRAYHLPPVQIGLYNPTYGARVLKDYTLSDITPLDQYKLYKVAENVKIGPTDYLYLFRSWNIQVDLVSALTSDPNQLYDIYVSMKFHGGVYGGDTSQSGAAYVDRVVVVRKTIYKFADQFSSTQGSGQWYYMQLSGSTYSNMTWNSGISAWKGNYTYNLIWQPAGIHPDTNDSVIGWKAPTAGTITVTGNVKKINLTAGDGVNVKLMQNTTQRWPASGWQSIAYNNSTGYNLNVSMSVAVNDMLYFIVNKNADGNSDGTYWNPTVTYSTPTP